MKVDKIISTQFLTEKHLRA